MGQNGYLLVAAQYNAPNSLNLGNVTVFRSSVVLHEDADSLLSDVILRKSPFWYHVSSKTEICLPFWKMVTMR